LYTSANTDDLLHRGPVRAAMHCTVDPGRILTPNAFLQRFQPKKYFEKFELDSSGVVFARTMMDHEAQPTWPVVWWVLSLCEPSRPTRGFWAACVLLTPVDAVQYVISHQNARIDRVTLPSHFSHCTGHRSCVSKFQDTPGVAPSPEQSSKHRSCTPPSSSSKP
jgi:hypothetical protein